VRAPWILYADLVATAFPLASGLVARGRLTPGRRWVVVWSGVFVVANLGALLLGMQSRNNHWITYVVTPITGALALEAFSTWQTSAIARLAMRLAIPLLAITWVSIVLVLENTNTFSLVAEPFAGLLILAAATYTLISRAFAEPGSLFRQDWFWIAVGMALYAGMAVALPPTAHWLLARHPELVAQAYQIKAAAEILALVLIARGVLCPIPAMPSGGSSLPGRSRSASFSSASSRRW
jgi:hypothetical protein